MENDTSLFHFYSYGRVVEDNPDNNKEIKVFPIEKLYTEGGNLLEPIPIETKFISKEVDRQPKLEEVLYKDKEEMVSIEKTKYLLVDWLGLSDSNRLTPPNVCKGEKVVIYRYNHNDELRWDTLDTDLKLRKEEHVIYCYSDKPNLDDGEDELEDRYYMMYSPKTKMVKLHTTMKYGEYTSYDFTIDTKYGSVELKDGKDNRLFLDSPKDTLTIDTNNEFNLNIKNTVNLYTTDINVNASGNMKTTVDGRYDIVVGNYTMSNGKDELIALIAELTQAVIDIQHVGNLKFLTAIGPASKATLQDIKGRVEAIK